MPAILSASGHFAFRGCNVRIASPTDVHLVPFASMLSARNDRNGIGGAPARKVRVARDPEMNQEENAAPESPDMRSSNSAENNAALFTRLIDHHIRFTVAKRQIQLSRHDWYRVTALAVRDMLVEQMLETRARFERGGAKKVFYLSVEYMIDRSLENNLFNLGII